MTACGKEAAHGARVVVGTGRRARALLLASGLTGLAAGFGAGGGPGNGALGWVGPRHALAAPPGRRDPDWPCQQIKVESLSLGALWNGPPLDQALHDWRSDKPAAALAARLSQRRVPLEQARAQIAAFAASGEAGGPSPAGADAGASVAHPAGQPGEAQAREVQAGGTQAGGAQVGEAQAGRRERLLDLYAGLFTILDGERSTVVQGLDRYGSRQKQLAQAVRDEADSLRTEQAAPSPDEARVQGLTQRLGWDTRVFEDRRQSIHYACDVPTVIEQRAFALAQAVQAALSP